MQHIIRPITVVSGLPRSGTSMMMRMLEAGGIEPLTDGVRLADEDNPGGYFELEQVKGLARGGSPSFLCEARGKAIKVISPLLRFLPRAHQYRVVMMERKLDEVLASQQVMLRHRGEPTNGQDEKKLAALYEEELRQIELWLSSQPNIRAIFVSYNGLLAEPLLELRRLAQFLDGPSLDLEAMASVIDPALYRQRK